MKPAPPPRLSLARATLFKMGARIAVIIALTTLFSYLHMLRTLRAQAVEQLGQHVSERSQREQAIFLLAEDNHAVLKKALEERIQALRLEDPNARFDRLFVTMPGGALCNRPEGFDGTRQVGLFVPRGVALDDEVRRRILAAYDVLSQYGPAFHTRFTDTFITLPEGPLVIYWPDNPAYCENAPPTERVTEMEYFTISLPEKDPTRQTVWSGVYAGPISKNWMATASTPLDMNGRHVATISHDVFLKEMVTRTLDDHLPGAYNMLVRDDGHVIVHPELKMDGAAGPYNILTGAEQTDVWATQANFQRQQDHLKALFTRMKSRAPNEFVQELSEHGEYIATARLQGPGWNFVTVLPESVVSAPAVRAARYVLLLGLLSLLLELAIMSWVLRQQITRPLWAFVQASDRVASGDFKVELETSRTDELGQVANAFQHMTEEVQRREEQLRRANEGLEQRVEERTRELKDVHQQLVQTARQAGMAEIATNVLHNVGNVLNSVYTSAQVAKERTAELRLENLSRVAAMLEEHEQDLPVFLTQDERGRHVRPFLSHLGKNLLEERQQILSLLEDVGRYTEHIGDIVKLQQNYARLPRLREQVHVADLLEDALRINEAGLGRHGVQVERDIAPLPPLLADKHKVLMILTNLISNAKYAVDGASTQQLIRLKLYLASPERLRIEVSDTGVGIAPELLTRIFQYGFTTRKEGHGFGLHSCALAAQELGGTLTAHSDGPGRGATFTLELPFVRAEETT
ncbi:MAG: ATP-binding protein [Hyalangium sp.]|uniref:ATP-binding protein n=1 Tax=Hyalangium sp. TaxID=2028555 RepID=UPI003899BF39